ncbi:haloacid dehalogenase-like hydrolase [Streptomyces sp. N2A]|uniref:haloacid dehalogenase-like hydrolase n=1 Tax=Streptomyces sp. N2A TaxID=3073936 RepID=UPI0028708B6E|nr:haloacid dehalogenase-like hydrolase [Streptomyces sp. N2A]
MLTKRRWLAAGAALAVVGGGVAVAQTATAQPAPHRCPTLQVSKGWYGDNHAKLQKMIDERGSCSGSGGARPVATFDWDNTVVKNDISDATLAWMLRHDKVLRPASWKATNKWLTDAAADALTKACGTSVPAGHPLPTSTDTDCTDEILDVYNDEKTSGGEPAFAGEWNHRRTVPSYVWITQLFAGHSPATLTSYAAKARTQNLAAPIGTEQTVGTHKWAGYIRYYEQQRDLIGTLKKAGFDVYIVSASAEPLVRAWAPGVGIDRDHIVGIRNVVRDGKLTTGVEGCGDVKDTNGEVLTYMDGKRCWINQEIFHVKGAKAWQQQDRAHRPAFAAGDAETDVTFVGDATAGHLAINRNKTELMCRAYDNADHRWIVNPMFIEPKQRKADPYPCASTGYTRPDGTLGPVHRADGSVVPDQQDTVY